MMPGEGWTLAPCEITRWLHVRGVHDADQLLEMAILNARAFNDPKWLGEETHRRERERREASRPQRSPMQELVGLFRGAGVPVREERGPA